MICRKNRMFELIKAFQLMFYVIDMTQTVFEEYFQIKIIKFEIFQNQDLENPFAIDGQTYYS